MHNAFQQTNWNALLRSPMQRVVRKKNRGPDVILHENRPQTQRCDGLFSVAHARIAVAARITVPHSLPS